MTLYIFLAAYTAVNTVVAFAPLPIVFLAAYTAVNPLQLL